MTAARYPLVVTALIGVVAMGTALAEQIPAAPSAVTDKAASEAAWSSDAGDLQSLGLQVSDLFVSLCKSNELPMQEVVDAKGQTIELTLRDAKMFFGSAFPARLDELICAKNPSICASRRLSKRATAQERNCGAEVNRHNLKRYPVWKNGPGSKISIPDISFLPEVRFRPVTVKPGTSIESMLQGRSFECSFFKAVSCLEATERQNDLVLGKIRRGNYSGTVYLPSMNLTTKFDVRGRPELFEALKANISLPTQIQKHSIVIGTSAADVSTLAAWRKQASAALGLPSTGLKSGGSVAVGILDGWTDDKHCLINYKLAKVHNSTTFDFDRNSCGLLSKNFDPEEEHATHLLGMLAATAEPVGGGVDPVSPLIRGLRVNTYQLDTQAFDGKTAMKLLADPANGWTYADPSEIYATSFTYARYPGTADSFEDWIVNPNRRNLYVASSGKFKAGETAVFPDPSSISSCNFYPVCRSLDSGNVVSVVALTNEVLEPKVLASSRFGIAFDVGAPGDSIPSTIRGNRIGRASGSSQSTIFVAGLAAMILEQNRNFTPLQVRNRLIATSDIFPSLYKVVFGGRVNANRALDLQKDVLVLRRTAKVQYNGRPMLAGGLPTDVIRADSTRDANFVVIRGEMDLSCRQYLFDYREGHDPNFPVNAFQIERLWRDRQSQQAFLFYDKPRDKKLKSLRVDRVVVYDHATAGFRPVRLLIESLQAPSATLDVAIDDVEEIVARTQPDPPPPDWYGKDCSK